MYTVGGLASFTQHYLVSFIHTVVFSCDFFFPDLRWAVFYCMDIQLNYPFYYT